ncbi:MAG: hypothetical protein ACOC90_07100, partial [Bacteroidota bacterium]
GSSGDDEVDSVVVDGTVPYYVEPDAVVNPEYSGPYNPEESNEDQDINSNFNWEESSGDVDLTSPSGEGTDESAPYREVTSASTGDYTIEVTEESAGGCESDDPTTQDILFISEPTYDLNETEYQICDGATQEISVDLSGNNDHLKGWSSYYFYMDNEKSYDEGNSTVYSHTDTIAEVGTTAGTATLLPSDRIFTAAEDGGDKQVTTYTFTLKGVNHHISRKGDFLDLPDNDGGDGKEQLDLTTYDSGTEEYNIDETLYSWYDETEQTITVTVYPTPETGDIYYVPNDHEL